MFDTAFIDFDNTLYNTRAFVDDVVSCLERYHVPRQVGRATLERAVHGDTGTYYDYSFVRHMGIMASEGYALPAGVMDALTSILEKNYQEPDAEFFLRELRKYSERIELVTAGNNAFQRQKLASTTLAPLLDDVYVLQTKKEAYVRSVIDSSLRYLFVNDNLAENIAVRDACPEVVVLTKRHPERYTEEELKASGIPYFDTLTDIISYLLSQKYDR